MADDLHGEVGDPPRSRLVVTFVGAHPDDDVMGALGLVARHRGDPGFRFVLVHATDGDAGEIAPGSEATRATLGATRREETRRAWALVRPPDRHEWLGHPDGRLAELPAGRLAADVAAVLAEERPDVVLTFGPDGISGHPDHIAIGRATTEAFHTVRATPGPGLRRLYHGAIPAAVLAKRNGERVAAGLTPFDPERIYDLRGVPNDAIAVTADHRDLTATIRDAFREHRSQWADPWADLDDLGWYRAAGAWHAVQAWPPWQPGSPRRTDPFEGL